MNEGYLDFLRFSIDKTKAVPESVESIDWSGLFDFAYKQTVLGIVFDGIQRLDRKWNAEEKMLLMNTLYSTDLTNLEFCLIWKQIV